MGHFLNDAVGTTENIHMKSHNSLFYNREKSLKNREMLPHLSEHLTADLKILVSHDWSVIII